MSWWVAGASFVAGTASSALSKKSKMEQARERRRAGRETLVTAAWNIRERNKWARHTSFEVLDAGTAKYVETAIAGKTAEASAKATAASSGAAVGSGTPRAVLSAIVQEAVDAQTQVLLDTNRNLKAIEYETENQNKSEWRNANLYVTQQNRVADNEVKAANRQFVADMIETTASSYASGATVGGANITKWPGMASTSGAVSGAVPQVSKGAHHLRSSAKISKGHPSKYTKIASSKLIGKGSTRSIPEWANPKYSGQSRRMGRSGGEISQRWYGHKFSKGQHVNTKRPFFYNLKDFFRGRGWSGKAKSKTFKY